VSCLSVCLLLPRDHRKLGQELDLFSINDAAGAGLVFWHPKVRRNLSPAFRAGRAALRRVRPLSQGPTMLVPMGDSLGCTRQQGIFCLKPSKTVFLL
jgi:hypothetical protein